jgi:hypothetical protein
MPGQQDTGRAKLQRSAGERVGGIIVVDFSVLSYFWAMGASSFIETRTCEVS